MPVPSSLSDLSTTAASNSPAGTDSIGTSLDDYLRSIQAILKQGVSKGSDITSANSISPPATSSYFIVTGVTTITAIADYWNGRIVFLKFSGILQLTHSAGLILPGSANITTAAGDVFAFVNESTGVWRCVFYQPTGGYLTLSNGLFYKADPATVAFTKTGAATISTQAAILYIEVNGVIKTITASTAVTMPSHSSGVDYAIWAKTDGTLEATSNHVTPPTANARKVGGYHYAPGGNATGVAGGDTTPAINAYSIWDLKFRPACPDPRGMTLVADSFWADIYLLGVDHPTNGSSKYNVTIADGSSPPKIPAKFGGNGSSVYSDGNWWNLNEVLQSWGKRAPAYDEFAALAYGTTEASSGGTDPTSTILRAAYTSKWGIMLATGNMYVWGAEFGGGAASAAWTANTGGRGGTYQMENAARFGGDWGNTSDAGSRASIWNNSPTLSSSSVGVRGVADHLILD